MKNIKTIKRNASNTMIAGVCGSMAEYFQVKPFIFRSIYASLTVLTAFIPGSLFYLFLMLIIPREQIDAE